MLVVSYVRDGRHGELLSHSGGMYSRVGSNFFHSRECGLEVVGVGRTSCSCGSAKSSAGAA
jgi:hypothetical protein